MVDVVVVVVSGGVLPGPVHVVGRVQGVRQVVQPVKPGEIIRQVQSINQSIFMFEPSLLG